MLFPAITSRVCLLICAAALSAGCQQKMADQPSYQPLEPSEFFADQRSARPAIPGTVARGQLRTDLALFTGRKTRASRQRPAREQNSDEQKSKFNENDDFVAEFPVALDRQLLKHGQDRFSIYCIVCHDSLGTGQGKIVERGYTRPPSLHSDRLRDAPVGRIFAVITEGYGSMPSYASQIPPEDRWAIVAYVRALQLSQHFASADLNDEMQQALRETESSRAQNQSTE
jgi:mono/diheme cytochrome c family protein